MKKGIFFALLISPILAEDAIPKKLQGLWLRKNDQGKIYLVQITGNALNEIECGGGIAPLTDARQVKKNCYGFTDPGGDAAVICLTFKGKKLIYREESRGLHFKSALKKFEGSVEDFQKKHCPTKLLE